MAQAGLTYVMDRGYVSIAFCRELMSLGAFFVIRERNNLQFRSLCELAVETHPCLQRLNFKIPASTRTESRADGPPS